LQREALSRGGLGLALRPEHGAGRPSSRPGDGGAALGSEAEFETQLATENSEEFVAHPDHLEVLMSVLVVARFQGDTAAFRQALQDRADEFVTIAERGRAAGSIHHRFGIGDGFVLVVDEWESADQFQAFFSDPRLQELIVSVGATPGPPDLTIAEAISSPDEF
jgi:hypothetical protein